MQWNGKFRSILTARKSRLLRADSLLARIRRLRSKFRPRRFQIPLMRNFVFTRISLRTFSTP